MDNSKEVPNWEIDNDYVLTFPDPPRQRVTVHIRHQGPAQFRYVPDWDDDDEFDSLELDDADIAQYLQPYSRQIIYVDADPIKKGEFRFIPELDDDFMTNTRPPSAPQTDQAVKE